MSAASSRSAEPGTALIRRQAVVEKKPGDPGDLRCHCGRSFVRCGGCQTPRCLDCDPYRSDDCAFDL